ncbi:putative protein phosphatase 2C 55-like protein, partial [Trifolium pratense]
SGFIVIRGGNIIFQSPVQQHSFNYPYQLGSDENCDLPSSGEVFTVPVEPQDVVVTGTDGLFDNLYTDDIIAVVVSAIIDRLEPEVTAQKIAALAQQRALDKNWQSPFSAAAREFGYHHCGGKLDDITVLVSYISSPVSDSFANFNFASVCVYLAAASGPVCYTCQAFSTAWRIHTARLHMLVLATMS